MKVVLTGYNTCCLNHTGGVQVRVKKIYELLSQRKDIEVEYFRPMETDFKSVDVLHLFKLEAEYFNLVMKAKSEGKKIVLSSVVPLDGGRKLDFFKLVNKLPVLTIYKMQQLILDAVDYVIAETHQEAQFIAKHYKVNSNKILVIANGIDNFNYNGNEIFEKIGGKKEYILQVGIVHENKNQLNTIRALKNTNIDLVIIGGENNGDMRYTNMCKKEAEGCDNIHFLGWVSNGSPLLKSAYAHAKVLAFPSFHETFGLVALEGAMAGCNMAMTKTLPIHDFHVFDDCWLFDPNNVEDMRVKLVDAFSTAKSNTVKERVTATFAWEKIINEHIELYKRIL